MIRNTVVILVFCFLLIGLLVVCGGSSIIGDVDSMNLFVDGIMFEDIIILFEDIIILFEDITILLVRGVYWSSCFSDLFLDVSLVLGFGSQYVDLFLNVICDDENIIVEINGLFYYIFVFMMFNVLVEVNYIYQIFLNFEVVDEILYILFLGYVVVVINGILIFGFNEGPIFDFYGDPIVNGIMDGCGGYTVGEYYYYELK